MFDTTSPRSRVWWVIRLRAAASGTYPRPARARSTRARVSGRTFGFPFTTRETVDCDARACAATSREFTWPAGDSGPRARSSAPPAPVAPDAGFMLAAVDEGGQ